MKLVVITPNQLPLVIAIGAVCLAFVILFNRFAQTTDAEKAIREGSLPKLIATINRHPDQLNKPNRKNGLTPLHWAVMGDRTNMVQLLLAKGADVHATDRYGWTPLHKAAAFNRVTLARMLMDKGADPLAFGIKYGLIRFAPIHLAAEAGFADMVKLFLDRGVDINLRTEGQNKVACLHIAAGKGHAEVVELLLKAGADVNARDAKNETPLHWARIADQEEVIDMLKIYDGTE